jgi:hypothetical protein
MVWDHTPWLTEFTPGIYFHLISRIKPTMHLLKGHWVTKTWIQGADGCDRHPPRLIPPPLLSGIRAASMGGPWQLQRTPSLAHTLSSSIPCNLHPRSQDREAKQEWDQRDRKEKTWREGRTKPEQIQPCTWNSRTSSATSSVAAPRASPLTTYSVASMAAESSSSLLFLAQRCCS